VLTTFLSPGAAMTLSTDPVESLATHKVPADAPIECSPGPTGKLAEAEPVPGSSRSRLPLRVATQTNPVTGSTASADGPPSTVNVFDRWLVNGWIRETVSHPSATHR